jgi:RluA family pseudouridine synthase
MAIPVLFEDEHLLALDKPPRLLTAPDPDDPDRTSLLKLLHAGIAQGKSWARERGLGFLMTAHRLDFETSGVLLLAKTKAVLAALANLFGAPQPIITFVALGQGAPAGDRFEVVAPLGAHPTKPGLMHIDRQHGKKSKTLVEVAERFAGYTLLRCRPLPDRPHQIRVHLQSVRLPLAGDSAYGGRRLLLSHLKRAYRLKPGQTERPLLSTAALHAERMELDHPVTGQHLCLVAEWPKDLRVAVKYLRRYAPA